MKMSFRSLASPFWRPFLIKRDTCGCKHLFAAYISTWLRGTNIYKPHYAQKSQRQTKRGEINLRVSEALLIAPGQGSVFSHYL